MATIVEPKNNSGMEELDDVKAICTSFFEELIQNRETVDEDAIRFHWREAVHQTAKEFHDIDDQQVYLMTEEVLWEHLDRNEAKNELNWIKEGF